MTKNPTLVMPRWTTEEHNFIKNNSSTLTDHNLALAFSKAFGRTVNVDCIRKQRQRLGIKKRGGRGICSIL